MKQNELEKAALKGIGRRKVLMLAMVILVILSISVIALTANISIFEEDRILESLEENNELYYKELQ